MTPEEFFTIRWAAHNKKESDPDLHLTLSEDEMDMIEECISDYAKQESIAFDIWKVDNGWTKYHNKNYQITYLGYNTKLEPVEYSTEQLYSLYQQSKPKAQ